MVEDRFVQQHVRQKDITFFLRRIRRVGNIERMFRLHLVRISTISPGCTMLFLSTSFALLAAQAIAVLADRETRQEAGQYESKPDMC
jgi:hypothetical protein